MTESSRTFDPSGPLRAVGWLCVIAGIGLFIVFATIGFNAGGRYYWGMLTAIIPIVGFVILRRASRRSVVRRRAARRWGHPPEGGDPPSYKKARAYLHELSLDDHRTVDDRTWDDLAMDELLSQIDVCYSAAGRNELYALLRECRPTRESSETRRRLVERLREDEEFRMSLLEEIATLDNSADHDPAPILSEEGLVEDRLFPLYVTLSATALFSLFSPALIGLRLGLLLIFSIFILNLWIYNRKSRTVSSLVPPLRGLFRIVRQAGRLARLDLASVGFDAQGLAKEVAKTSALSRSFRSVLTGSSVGMASAGADIVETLTIYVKIIFLIDLIAYSRLAKGIRRLVTPLKRIYRAVGYLDAVHAVASFLEWADGLCTPQMLSDDDAGNGPVLRATDLYHPLIEEAVANSIELRRPGAVVTGTNMAGKSTFLRALGINAILAQTIGACFAESYEGARFLVMSSIEKRDVLQEGKSFYYAEAERIFRMIENLQDETPVLLLIDELLSGTNSLERESASVAILDYLSQRNALTVAATHDVTIARRLDGRFAVHYFTDRATDNGLSFDYRIRPGIVATRNAIRLLSLIGYPQEVIDAALRGAGEDSVDGG